jgi:hypothetical protein
MKKTAHVKQLKNNVVVDTLPRTVGSVFNDISRSSISSRHATISKRQRFLDKLTKKSKVTYQSVSSMSLQTIAN